MTDTDPGGPRGARAPRLSEVAAAEDTRLRPDPNIVGVGVGLKEVGGRPTWRAALKYFVLVKHADEDAVRAAGSEPVAADVAGFSTDVVELRPDRPHGVPTGTRDTREED